MLQWYYSGNTVVSQWYHSGVTVVLQWWYGCWSNSIWRIAGALDKPCKARENWVGVLQWSHRGVPVVYLWWHSVVTVVLQWCYSGVTVVLQWCYRGVTVVVRTFVEFNFEDCGRTWLALCVDLCIRRFFFAYPFGIGEKRRREERKEVTAVQKWCSIRVTFLLHSYDNAVTVISQWFYNGVTVVLQQCYSGVQLMLPERKGCASLQYWLCFHRRVLAWLCVCVYVCVCAYVCVCVCVCFSTRARILVLCRVPFSIVNMQMSHLFM
jgi:hypothetical protein